MGARKDAKEIKKFQRWGWLSSESISLWIFNACFVSNGRKLVTLNPMSKNVIPQSVFYTPFVETISTKYISYNYLQFSRITANCKYVIHPVCS